MSRARALIISLLVPCFGLLVSLVALEVIIRLATPSEKGPAGPSWTDRPAFYFRSPKVPSMQDLPYAIPKPPGIFRVAVIGNSFSFAPYMQLTDTFAKKLEQMLNINTATNASIPVTPDAAGSLRAEVINYGVPAYSTSHEIPVVKRAIQEGADLVILQITLNDPEVKVHRPTGILENMADRFAPKKPTGAFGWLCRHWRTLGFAMSRIYNTQTHRAYIDYFNDLFENPKSWPPFKQAVTQIAAVGQNKKVPVVAVVFPLFGIPMDDHYPFYPIHKKVADLLESLQVPHLDVSSIYKGIPLEHLQVIPGVDRHPNEIAHRMAAERIYLWLEGNKSIPEQLVITDKLATRLGVQDQRPWQGELPYSPE